MKSPADLEDAVRRRAERQDRAQREGEPTLAVQLARVGVLGWIVVVPTVLGVLAGRWLDARFDSGLTWTGALLLAGLALGCWSGWRWMHGT